MHTATPAIIKINTTTAADAPIIITVFELDAGLGVAVGCGVLSLLLFALVVVENLNAVLCFDVDTGEVLLGGVTVLAGTMDSTRTFTPIDAVVVPTVSVVSLLLTALLAAITTCTSAALVALLAILISVTTFAVPSVNSRRLSVKLFVSTRLFVSTVAFITASGMVQAVSYNLAGIRVVGV
jgi:hypothetical protein